MKNFLMGACVFALAGSAFASTIASQDFNALDDSATFTTDSITPTGPLTNGSSFNSGGGGIDFTSIFTDTRGAAGPLAGSESGDFIGVSSFGGGGAPDTAPDGTPVASGVEHNYQFNDTDGLVDLTFAAVDTTGFTGREVSFAYLVADTGYESDDFFSATISDGTNSVTFLDLDELGMEAAGAAGSADVTPSVWLNASFLVPDGWGNSLSLTIGADTSSGSENVFVDDVLFTGVPEPTSLILMGLGAVALIRRR